MIISCIKKLHLVMFIAFTFYCCKTESSDYRHIFSGEFHFTTIRSVIEMCYDCSENCVDGWTVYMSDTTRVTSEIELFGDNRLRIKFGEGQLGIFNDNIISQTFYPKVSPNGDLSYPELMNICSVFFSNFCSMI